MDQNRINKEIKLTKQRNYNSPKEKRRLLTTYAGIFPDNINDYAKLLGTKKVKKDYSL